MRLIVGLGNPGTQYARTRHNVGWLVLDELGRRWGAVWRKEKDAELAEIRVGAAPGTKLLLVRPLTFMNASGKAVGPLMAFYKLEPDALLAVQDDLDSPFGLLKFRPSGRHGGQNGIRDLIRVLGTEAFPRLKIGISRPPAGSGPRRLGAEPLARRGNRNAGRIGAPRGQRRRSLGAARTQRGSGSVQRNRPAAQARAGETRTSQSRTRQNRSHSGSNRFDNLRNRVLFSGLASHCRNISAPGRV